MLFPSRKELSFKVEPEAKSLQGSIQLLRVIATEGIRHGRLLILEYLNNFVFYPYLFSWFAFESLIQNTSFL